MKGEVQYYEKLEKRYPQVKVVTWDGPFNYSAINNFGAKYADGDYLLLLNNDTEVITPEWLENMMGYCQREDVGIVGAKLLYPDNTVQHAGVVVGIAGFAGHILTGYDRYATGTVFNSLRISYCIFMYVACNQIINPVQSAQSRYGHRMFRGNNNRFNLLRRIVLTCTAYI